MSVSGHEMGFHTVDCTFFLVTMLPDHKAWWKLLAAGNVVPHMMLISSDCVVNLVDSLCITGEINLNKVG